MADLRPEQFSDFFRAVHGVDPFPWQENLAQTVFRSNWPGALDIPTGAGKTAAIDIGVFHLALEADRGAERQAAARILFVVDRRLIVDDAYERAKKIADKLARPEAPILKAIAENLQTLAEDRERPLSAVRLRGGMPKEPDWVRTPSQPTVVVSTVDQVGSRLLFRGYGVSDSMKPIHAGLLGADSLLLLDEAHLSQPFRQTVRDSLLFRGRPWSENRAPAPFRLITLSATLSAEEIAENEPFRLSEQDRTHQVLAPRLSAPKLVELIECKSETELEHQLAENTWDLRELNGAATVLAVVVNRVRRARAIFNALLTRGAKPFGGAPPDRESPSSSQVALLIGRMRPSDRDDLMEQLLPFLRALPAGGTRPSPGTPLIVVATQCIEAGADLDFDALLTEIAPLDCLRQRFGRLNRMGRGFAARGAIVAAMDQVRKSAEDDPIYGSALKTTWSLLIDKAKSPSRKRTQKRVIDFGIEASERWFPRGKSAQKYLSPKSDAPVLMPVAVALWGRTSPIPSADPEVSLYLHGPMSGPGDVEIVWRADIEDDIEDEQRKQRAWTDLVAICPPAAREAISIPIGEARNWLLGKARAEVSDTEASLAESQDRAHSSKTALRWRGIEGSQIVQAGKVSPGDVLVVPSSRGGCDRWGWNPLDAAGVLDLGRRANLQQRGREILRVSKADLTEAEIQSTVVMSDWSDAEVRENFKSKFENLNGGDPRRLRVVRSRDRRPLAIELKLPRNARTPRGDAVTEDDGSVYTGQRSVLLSAHSKGVEYYARRFASQSGLPQELIEDLALSGFLHDAGKAHPDFKRFLYGGDELAANGPDLAKSARLPPNAREWDELRLRSGLPRGARHEIASLCFAAAHNRFEKAHDRDLVLWLVGTHHGHGRPFFPAETEWPRKGETFEADLGDGKLLSKTSRSLAELTSQWFELFERVTTRYGVWGLARLEAILRLADHRESEKEQDED